MKRKTLEERAESVPRVGDDIYVPTRWYLSHGADDKLGGLAEVTSVWQEGRSYWVSVKEVSGAYNWTGNLSLHQEEWRKEYGSQRARPDPDLHPSANRWD